MKSDRAENQKAMMQVLELHLALDGVAFLLKEQIHSLGELLDPQDARVVSVARGGFPQLWLVCQLRLYLRQSDLVMVIHDPVTFHSDYCNTLNP